MAKTARVDRPAPPIEMGRVEAEAVTQAIKDNFDSLGAMLIQARDRKAYKALGYRTFESYCKTEFGKSSSSAYRLIEDVKVVARLEAEIAKQYNEPVSLDIPSACLRPLKEIPDIGEKLRAIDYAKKLATAEGKKPSKKHLEIAVFEISGKRSEDFRSAIQNLGFTRGVAVEVTKNLKKDRGAVTKVDKLGKVHVQFYGGGADPISLDARDLRILTDAEKPTIPLNEITASKGDRVLIFAQGLEGKKGTIYTWRPSEQALVMVDGENGPIDIAYAEMELIRGEGEQKQKDTNWDSELVWNTGKNTYYYFPQEDIIYSDTWPQGLALKPHSHEKNPIEFMGDWEDKFAGNLLEALTTPARLKTLALAQAIELPEDEGKEFAADLIASLNQLFPQTSNDLHFEFLSALNSNDAVALTNENQRLREQLVNAESAIEAMVNAASTASVVDAALDTNVDAPEVLSVDAVNAITKRNIGTTEALSVEIVDITLDIPVDTTEALDVDIVDTGETQREVGHDDWSKWNASAGLKAEIAQWRNKTNEAIARDNRKLASATRQPEKDKLDKQIDRSRSRLLELAAFEKIEIGQTVEKKVREGVHGEVTKLDISPGGLPQIWVLWSDRKYAESSSTFSLNLSPVISPPSSSLDPDTEENIRLLRENLLTWKAHAEEELAAAEEHNKSIFTRKIEVRNSILKKLQEFSKLRVGQYVVDKLSPRRGKVIAMHAKTERLALEIEWVCGKTELMPFKDIVPEQMSEERQAITLLVE